MEYNELPKKISNAVDRQEARIRMRDELKCRGEQVYLISTSNNRAYVSIDALIKVLDKDIDEAGVHIVAMQEAHQLISQVSKGILEAL